MSSCISHAYHDHTDVNGGDTSPGHASSTLWWRVSWRLLLVNFTEADTSRLYTNHMDPHFLFWSSV